jgi:hypothetical protein
MADRVDIEFPADDGVTLRGWPYRPAGAKARSRTVRGGEGTWLRSLARAFAEAGFVVLVHDHRGLAVARVPLGRTLTPGAKSPIGAVPSRILRAGQRWTANVSGFRAPATPVVTRSSSVRLTGEFSAWSLRSRQSVASSRGDVALLRKRPQPWKRPSTTTSGPPSAGTPGFHVADALALENGRIDTAALQPVGRLAAEYVLIESVFTCPVADEILDRRGQRMRRLDERDPRWSPLAEAAWSAAGEAKPL